jgi:hypothetical protein
MTDEVKDAAIHQLGAFQKSLKEGLGKDVSPLQLNKIKQSLGNRMNWGGTISVTDDIKPALRSVYGTMNKLISDAVPQAKELNERLSNLYAAQSDLETLTKAEEVGRGGGVTGGKVWLYSSGKSRARNGSSFARCVGSGKKFRRQSRNGCRRFSRMGPRSRGAFFVSGTISIRQITSSMAATVQAH